MRDSMVYYYTPAELVAKTASNPSVHDLGVKVGGRVVPGTVRFDPRTLDLRFDVVGIATETTRFPIRYQGPLPDTFEEGRDVVVEGRFTPAGLFEATTVLTRCVVLVTKPWRRTFRRDCHRRSRAANSGCRR